MIAAEYDQQHVEIYSAAGSRYGTGCLIAPRLVLTARHVVHPIADSSPSSSLPSEDAIEVRFGLERDAVWQPATVVWTGDGAVDLALIKLKGEAPAAMRDVRFGMLAGRNRARSILRARCLGFPALQEGRLPEGQSFRDTILIEAAVRSANARSKLISVAVDKVRAPGGADWSGMSGAPLFVEQRLVGIVTRADQNGLALHAVPLTAVLGGEEATIAPFRTNLDSVRSWRSICDEHGLRTTVDVVHRQPHAKTLEWYARQHSPLLGREAEMSRFRQWLAAGQRYAVWTGDPWAGKTALAATLASGPPDNVDVIFHLANHGLGSATFNGVLSSLTEQLAALLDEEPSAPSQYTFDQLIADVATAQRQLGRHTLILIDGLDELANREQARRVLNLLPAAPPANLSIALFLRPSLEISTLLGADHPLARTDSHDAVSLGPSPHATRIRDRAIRDLTEIFTAGGLAPRTAECVAAVGPLALRDLARALDLTDPDADALHQALTGEPLNRVLVPLPSAVAPRYGFAHDTLRSLVLDRADRPPDHYRRVMAQVGDEWAHNGWPDRTPDFYIDDYPAMLAALGDLDRLAKVALSPVWLGLLRRRGPTAPSASDVLRRALGNATQTSEDQWPTLVSIGIRLHEIAPVLEHYPLTLILAWQLTGDTQRARQRAQQLADPQDRAEAQLALATSVLDHEQPAEARILLGQAATSALSLDVASLDVERRIRHEESKRTRVVVAAANPDRGPWPPIDPPEAAAGTAALLLAQVGLAAHRLGEIGLAVEMNDAIWPLLDEPGTGRLPARVLLDAVELALILGNTSRAGPAMHRLDDEGLDAEDKIRRIHLSAVVAGRERLVARPVPPEREPYAGLDLDQAGPTQDRNERRLHAIRLLLARGDVQDAAHLVDDFVPEQLRFLDMHEDWAAIVAGITLEAARQYGPAARPAVAAAERFAQRQTTKETAQTWLPHVGTGLTRSNEDHLSEPAGTFLADAVEAMCRAGRLPDALAAAELTRPGEVGELMMAAFAVGAARAGDTVTAVRLLAGARGSAMAMVARDQIAQHWVRHGRWREAVDLMARRIGYEYAVVNGTAIRAAITAGAVDEGMALLRACRPNELIPDAYPGMAAEGLAEIGYWDAALQVTNLFSRRHGRLAERLSIVKQAADVDADGAAAVLERTMAEIPEVEEVTERMRLWAQAAVAAQRLDRKNDARTAARAAIRTARGLADPKERSSAVLELVALAEKGGQPDLALALLRNATRDARQVPQASRASTLADVAATAYDLGQLDLGDELADEVLAIPEPPRGQERLIVAAAKQGRPDRAERLLRSSPPRTSGLWPSGISAAAVQLSEMARTAARAGLWNLAEQLADAVPEEDRAEIFGDLASTAVDEQPALARRFVVRGLLTGLSPRLLAAATRLNPDVGPQAIAWFGQQATGT